MTSKNPTIPKDMLAGWQRVVDLMARAMEVPAGLIMRLSPPEHRVFVTSSGSDNPYSEGLAFQLGSGLYCDRVMADRSLLEVRDALQEEEWAENPDIEHGMTFYMGLPLTWPDGSLFGTICVLDRQDNPRAVSCRDLLAAFREVVDGDLKLLIELAERRRVEVALQEAHDLLETRIEERTRALTKANADLRRREQELEETNTALKVLIEKIELAKQEVEERIVWNVNEQIVPYLEKVKRLTSDARTTAYLAILEANIHEIASAFPARLSTAFQSLTPTEIEVAKLIIQGRSSKEIADLMSIATSTINFHRDNIRKKVGVKGSNVSLRSYLISLG